MDVHAWNGYPRDRTQRSAPFEGGWNKDHGVNIVALTTDIMPTYINISKTRDCRNLRTHVEHEVPTVLFTLRARA